MVTLNPAFTHSGFEKIVKKDTKILDSADFHHQLHHRYFDCNYGNMDVPLDVWFGTDHDGSEAATLRLREIGKGNVHELSSDYFETLYSPCFVEWNLTF